MKTKKAKKTIGQKIYEENKEQMDVVYGILKKYLDHVIEPSKLYDMTERQQTDFIQTGLYVA